MDYVASLQEKYGVPDGAYYLRAEKTGAWRKNQKITRLKSDGLYIHHVKEMYQASLSMQLVAKAMPYEAQEPHNLVYCDLLEHLKLHILIAEMYIADPGNIERGLGIGGASIIISIANDWYNGDSPKETSTYYQAWKKIENRRGEYKGLMKMAQRCFCTIGMPRKLKTLSYNKIHGFKNNEDQ